MGFEVQQRGFSGPLALLLELVAEQKMPITDVALAEVADGFLRYIKEQNVSEDELADFLVVATRLIYLKSRALLPSLATPAEDAAGDALIDQLRAYEVFAHAAFLLGERYGLHAMATYRGLPVVQTVNDMPAGVTQEALRSSFAAAIKRLEPFMALREASMERVQSVEERMRELEKSLADRAQVVFSDVVRGAERKIDVVVSFLALLELLRRRSITVSQGGAFEDILLASAGEGLEVRV